MTKFLKKILFLLINMGQEYATISVYKSKDTYVYVCNYASIKVCISMYVCKYVLVYRYQSISQASMKTCMYSWNNLGFERKFFSRFPRNWDIFIIGFENFQYFSCSILFFLKQLVQSNFVLDHKLKGLHF